MMGAVEVDADEVVAPAHIDDGDENAVLVVDGVSVRFRWRKTCSYEQQSSERFVRRLSSTVDEL